MYQATARVYGSGLRKGGKLVFRVSGTQGSCTFGKVQMGSRGRSNQLVREGESDSRVVSGSRLEMGVRWGYE